MKKCKACNGEGLKIENGVVNSNELCPVCKGFGVVEGEEDIIFTTEDMTNNPELSEQDINVGDTVLIPELENAPKKKSTKKIN